MVVIAIIGMLISILLPSLRRSMSLASATVCQFNLKEVGHAILMYRVDNDDWLPVAEKREAGVATGGIETVEPPTENLAWFVKLFPMYLQDPAILSCPDDPFGFRINDARYRFHEPDVAEFSSYGINNFLISFENGMLADLDRHKPNRPAETILLCDLGPDEVNRNRPASITIAGPMRNSSLVMWGDGFDPFGTPSQPWVTSRHNHAINMITVAGSVRRVTTETVLRAPIQRYYDRCAAGDCPLCKELGWFHYSFAHERLYWWTGAIPKE